MLVPGHDVFISYASADRPRVVPLVEALQQKGWSVWWDRTIPPGKTWDQVIASALDKARCVVVVWSKESVASDYVKEEAEEGKRRGILVPARIDEVIIPFGFRRIQAADLVGWSGALPNGGFDELAGAVSGVLGVDIAKPAAKAAAASAAEAADTATTVPAEAKPQPPPTAVDARDPPLARSIPSIFKYRFVLFGLAAVLLILIVIYVQGHKPETTKIGVPAPKQSPSVSPLSPTTTGQENVKSPAPQSKSVTPSATDYKANPSAQVSHKELQARLGAAAKTGARVNPKDGLNYVLIPPGRFKMGCSAGDSQRYEDESPAHEVHISKSFWLGQTEVTQAAWKKVMNSDPSRFKGDQLPVDSVSRFDAGKYCEAVGGRLPTEAEWEYAARAGSNAARYGDLDAIAWYDKNSGNTSHAVGGKQANQFGLFDMLGNVWEWVQDDYAPYKPEAATDPAVVIKDSAHKVVRGGSWFNLPRYARASLRSRSEPVDRNYFIGFRCVGEFP